jgi:hypothetical protein
MIASVYSWWPSFLSELEKRYSKSMKSFDEIFGPGRSGTSQAGACWRCDGVGWYGDGEQAQTCQVCCSHTGWWLLSAHQAGFSEDHDTWACGRGCGTLTSELDCQHSGWCVLENDQDGFSPYGERWTCRDGCGAFREPEVVHARHLAEYHIAQA